MSEGRRGAGPRRRDPNRCGRDHDLTDPKNRIEQPDGTWKCRLCKVLTNHRLRDLLHVRTTCMQCGGAKRANKMRLCDPCRWRNAVRKVQQDKIDDPGDEDVEKRLSEAVALECEPWWVRKDAEEKRRKAMDEARRALRRGALTQTSARG